jgi:hypothetical protein
VSSPTLLQEWLKIHGLPSARVEKKLQEKLHGRAPSRRQFARWRQGRVDIRRKDMVRILWAIREVTDDQSISIGELFCLDPADAEIWQD